MRHWAHTPPAALQLKRIALFVGLKPDKPAPVPVTTAEEATQEGHAAGFPVERGRPDDPVLDLIGW